MASIKFELPKSVKHDETKAVMEAIVRQLRKEGRLRPIDLPQLHRMATSYDLYITANEEIARTGAVMINIKGEVVKHPYTNIVREMWNEFLRIAREYGVTPKSEAQMSSHKPTKQDKAEKTPLETYFQGKK